MATSSEEEIAGMLAPGRGYKEIDPRIEIELETLNQANDAINRLELEVDSGRASLRSLERECSHQLGILRARLGPSVDVARPYYEGQQQVKDKKQKLERSTLRLERAQNMYAAAREMMALAEQHLNAQQDDVRIHNAAWQEMLTEALQKSEQTDHEMAEADEEQRSALQTVQAAEHELSSLERSLRSSIRKSRPFYELEERFRLETEFHGRKVFELDKCVREAKAVYQASLVRLERISEEIHSRRQLGERSQGEGEETPPRRADVSRLRPPVPSQSMAGDSNESLNDLLDRVGGTETDDTALS